MYTVMYVCMYVRIYICMYVPSLRSEVHRARQVRPEQVDLLTSFTEDDRKEALVASYGGRLYMAYRDRRDRLPETRHVISTEFLGSSSPHCLASV